MVMATLRQSDVVASFNAILFKDIWRISSVLEVEDASMPYGQIVLTLT